jgi:hypothetical protein
MVDLHGLHIPEAIHYVKQRLRSASLSDHGEVRFIVGTSFNELSCVGTQFVNSLDTGKGLHSDDGAKLRPAVEKLCVEYVEIL